MAVRTVGLVRVERNEPEHIGQPLALQAIADVLEEVPKGSFINRCVHSVQSSFSVSGVKVCLFFEEYNLSQAECMMNWVFG